MPTKTYHTSEFKREAVKLALSSEQPIAATARELGVKENSLYTWVNLAMKKKNSTTTSLPLKSHHRYQEMEKENKQLKKDLKRAQMERDILKKAALSSTGHCNNFI